VREKQSSRYSNEAGDVSHNSMAFLNCYDKEVGLKTITWLSHVNCIGAIDHCGVFGI
jgi:hypothetical protein